MSAVRKKNPEKSVSPRQPKEDPDQPAAKVDEDAASLVGLPSKSGKPEVKAEFAQGTFYRQGVLVPGWPHKGAMPRTRNR